MRPIGELLKKRSGEFYSVAPQDTVYAALQRLADHDVGAMMVLEQGTLVGVVSERDYTRKIALAGKSSRDTLVRDIMTSNVVTVSAQTPTRAALLLMNQNRFRHLPVLDGGRLLGMISIRDLMGDIIAAHEFTIDQLEHCITS